MQALRPVDYPAIARAQRLSAHRLGGGTGSSKVSRTFDTAPAETTAAGVEQRSCRKDDTDPKPPKCVWYSGSAAAPDNVGRSLDNWEQFKRRSLDERRTPSPGGAKAHEGGPGDDVEKSGSRRQVGGPWDDEEKQSPSLERTLRDMEQIADRVREEALALERFFADEASPAVQKVFDAAVAQHAEACRLLSVENLPLPPAPSQVAAAAAREKSRNIDNGRNSNGYTDPKSLSGGSTATKNSQRIFASVSGHADHTKQASGGQHACAETGGRPKRRLSAGSASVTDMVAQARRQEKREDTEDSRYEGNSNPGASASAMSDTTTDMGIAVVEVLQVSARGGAEGGGGRSGGGDDVETDESEAGGGGGGRSRPVQTDISAKIVGLSTLIRKKAAEASASRRRKP